MADDNESKLKIYSVGIVVNDKPDGTDIIDVYPVEKLPMINGPIGDYTKTYKANVPNASNTPKQNEVKGTATVQARWLGLGCGNRISAPDVVKNESVLLFKYADSEVYYWEKHTREPEIRRLENVLTLYGGIKKYGIPLDKTNSYWVHISPKEGFIQIHTSKANGEPYAYDIRLDTHTGLFTFTDNSAVSITIDSKDESITFNAKTVNFTGNIVIKGDTNQEGNVYTKGNTDLNGNVNSTGEFKNNGKIF